MCAMTLTSIGLDLRNKAKNDRRNANCELLQFFSKTVLTIRTKISTAIHFIWGTYVCSDNNIVKLGFEKQPKLTKEQPIVNFFTFFKDSQHHSNEIFHSHFEAY